MNNTWSAAARWWDEWQMRILISGSLMMQWFLLLAAPMRMFTIPGWLRRLIWLAYISCDALAIYALATLFNRQTKTSSPCQAGGVRASSLEVLWAPVLLIHLGGHDVDNEMWTRHTITMVTQVTVAVYSFCKSWPDSSDRRLLWSALLLFVVGILSFCEKPWALRRASTNRLVSIYSALAADDHRRKKPAERWVEFLFTELDLWTMVTGRGTASQRSAIPVLSDDDRLRMMLSDMSLGMAAKAVEVEKFGRPQDVDDILVDAKFKMEAWLRHALRRAFGLIYTRANVVSTPAYLACHFLLMPSMNAAAIALFATSHKEAYRQFNAADVKMTSVVLCFTAVLDVFGVLISELLYWVLYSTGIPALCETLPGGNILDAVQKMRRPVAGRLISCARTLGYEGHFFHRDDRHNPYVKVAGFVVADLFGSEVRGLDLAGYRSRDKDANWALFKKVPFLFEEEEDMKDETKAAASAKVWRSLRDLPFDESVLQWHIATDLFCRLNPPPRGQALAYAHYRCAEAISNYMAHLLNCRPDMLMTGSRQHLFNEACQNMDAMGRVAWRSIQDAKEDCGKYAVLKEAWRLAYALSKLQPAG